jgi:hypothetical protein
MNSIKIIFIRNILSKSCPKSMILAIYIYSGPSNLRKIVIY